MLGAGGIGAETSARKALEQVNRHFLTPAAIELLKTEMNASDADIARLENVLRPLLRQELTRLMGRQ